MTATARPIRAVYRPSNGYWYVIRSSDGVATSTDWSVSSADKPVPGDYDGDGKTDLAVWTPSKGQWVYRRSTDGARVAVAWGKVGDRLVPGDYDGDGKTDEAYYHPTDQTWNVLRSTDGGTTRVAWGFETDDLMPADYDGDGKTDFAVWRPTEGNWYIWRSSDGVQTTTAWGQYIDRVPYNCGHRWELACPDGTCLPGAVPYQGQCAPLSANCSGYNPTTGRLTAPYDCNVSDFDWMVKSGWPADSRRRKVIQTALDQIQVVGNPYDSDVLGTGLCDRTAWNHYDGDAHEWCSEFVRDLYLWGGIRNVEGDLDSATTVDDLRTLFADFPQGWTYSQYLINGWVEPGDYIAGFNSDGDPFGHSMMVFAVTEDIHRIFIIQGNSGVTINGEGHHCVKLNQATFYDDNYHLNSKFSGWGFLARWF